MALSFIRMCHSEERSDDDSMTTNILLLERLVVTDSSLRRVNPEPVEGLRSE